MAKHQSISVRYISSWRFHKKLEDLHVSVRSDILEFINKHSDAIDHYEYGRIPGHRIYCVVLTDGTHKDWSVQRSPF